MREIFTAYAITFGWALVGSVSMALGIIIALKLFDWSTSKVDEWQLIKENNTSIAIIFAAIILAVGYVVAACVRP
jgi:uncharacterized membrane protein YjfL (UPF0719 family)